MYLCKCFENICPHKTWHVYSIFIQNPHKSKATKISSNVWMDKQTEIHLHYGILFSDFLKMGYLVTKDIKELLGIVKWKKPFWKGYLLYDSNYQMF